MIRALVPRLKQTIRKGKTMYGLQMREGIVIRSNGHMNTIRVGLGSIYRRNYQYVLKVFILSEMAVFPQVPLGISTLPPSGPHLL